MISKNILNLDETLFFKTHILEYDSVGLKKRPHSSVILEINYILISHQIALQLLPKSTINLFLNSFCNLNALKCYQRNNAKYKYIKQKGNEPILNSVQNEGE